MARHSWNKQINSAILLLSQQENTDVNIHIIKGDSCDNNHNNSYNNGNGNIDDNDVMIIVIMITMITIVMIKEKMSKI